MSDNKGDRLSRYVSNYLQMKRYGEMMEADTVRFSVTLDYSDNKRLEVLLKRLGMKKTEFVREAVNLLMMEFESQLGLNPYGNNEYGNQISDNKKRIVKKLKDGTDVIINSDAGEVEE